MRKADVDLHVLYELASQITPGTGQFSIERPEGGVSTQVYRLRRDAKTFYLRIAEEREVSLAPEVLVHGLLHEQRVKVPEVVYFEPFNEALERSVMLTTEVTGSSIGESHMGVDVHAVLVQAGRDLAAVNRIHVEGFGWIRRDQQAAIRLEAELPTLRAFALDRLEEYLTLLRGSFLTDAETRTISQGVTRYDAWLDVEQAHLVHGDFDVTHIYHQDGAYSGIIDFGEIRGADPFYDLGHFALHDGETLPTLVLPYLLQGYGEVTPLLSDHEWRIRLWSILIGVRALARSIHRPGAGNQSHLGQAIRRSLAALQA